MQLKDAEMFCSKWLPSWTGGVEAVENLLSFYSEDTFYLDPVMKEGIHGKKRLSQYFNKLLAKNPDWKWNAVELIPTLKGFTLKWQATFPKNESELILFGLDIVEIENNLISRNEVYFDRSDLLT
ncbi:hypothetical protein LEAN103870_05115 [Legionella anisa]|uniref:Nuclear transport factor 2 family protein n=1 Tax=Legionella anisa TaxID=28082 RepID=A0AAX0WN47_9GAMM|nr:hypothetical protein [Legionella anisa]AWN73154.1 hypothetical protein DLD14_04475 [Legionella anisa]KTC67410.1 hypothetical protein Lani_3755 [Legionella anisa]MBN5936124.1 hypothetical protein [Legionella anisa]MCW8423985.1 hypothetical protein [Legionella anisa]MCW8447507.1 hypothetical protein [Legionella anisa]